MFCRKEKDCIFAIREILWAISKNISFFFCSVALLEHKITVYLRSFFLKNGKKFIELLRMTARIICNEQIFIRSKTIMRQLISQFLLLILLKLYNEEFDPGSGWTLAAGLTHASRTVTEKACFLLTSGERVRNAYATYLFLRNSPEKFGLIPYNNIHSHVWIFKAFAEKDGHAWH